MPWERRRYRKNKVWVRVDADGALCCDGRGLAALRYRADDTKTYTVRPDELAPVAATDADDDDAIHVWIRVAEGPVTGAGVVLAWRGRERAFERICEETAPDQARDEAIRAALAAIRRPELPVRVHAEGTSDRANLADAADPGRRFADLCFVEAAPAPECSPDRQAARLAREAAAHRGEESGAGGAGSA